VISPVIQVAPQRPEAVIPECFYRGARPRESITLETAVNSHLTTAGMTSSWSRHFEELNREVQWSHNKHSQNQRQDNRSLKPFAPMQTPCDQRSRIAAANFRIISLSATPDQNQAWLHSNRMAHYNQKTSLLT